MSQPIEPEIGGFGEEVGSLVLRDHSVGGQKPVVKMEFPVEKETGMQPHEDLIAELESVVENYHSG